MIFFFCPLWTVLVPRLCCRESGEGEGRGWHLQSMMSENDALKSRMAFKEAETIRIVIIILVRNSNIQAVTRISETTPVQNGNRATTRLEPAIVSRRQQLLGGVIIHKHKMSLSFWQYMSLLAFNRTRAACFCPVVSSVVTLVYVAAPSMKECWGFCFFFKSDISRLSGSGIPKVCNRVPLHWASGQMHAQ